MVDGLAYDDLDLFGRELDDPEAELEQDLWHRLIEPKGSNPDDINRGIGLIDRIGGPVDANLARVIESDFLTDDRVASVVADIEQTGPGVYRIDITVNQDTTLSAELSATGVRRLVAP